MKIYYIAIIHNNKTYQCISTTNYNNKGEDSRVYKTITDLIDDEGFVEHFQKYVDDESIDPINKIVIPLDKIINEWVTKVRQDKLNSLLYDK